MTAREMFKELGFSCYKEYRSDFIYYTPDENHFVSFDLVMKHCYFGDMSLDAMLLKAIKKQFEELGWI